MEFSAAAMKRAIKGETYKRVSLDAAEELGAELESFGSKVASLAVQVAVEDGRKTVRSEDVRAALREVE